MQLSQNIQAPRNTANNMPIIIKIAQPIIPNSVNLEIPNLYQGVLLLNLLKMPLNISGDGTLAPECSLSDFVFSLESMDTVG
ncbi:MAG TPA: hypothetical protein DCZ94_19445 [Lentisphaeria bacterium]|nr:hypothetical protein [Lentisphaeria bacterium]